MRAIEEQHVNFESERSQLEHNHRSGVFTYLAGECAFIDRIEVSVAGEKRDSCAAYFRKSENVRIGSTASFYNWKIQGIAADSGNPVVMKYARKSGFQNVPQLIVDFRSERVPVTGAQVLFALERLTTFEHATISALELTFDLAGLTPQTLCRQVFTKQRQYFSIGSPGNSTEYFGSRTSPWQLRAYRKDERHGRIEFVLRRPYLRKQAFHSVQSICALRQFELTRLASFRIANEEEFLRISRTHSKRKLLARTLQIHPQIVAGVLVDEGFELDRVFPYSPLHRKLRQMLKNLVW